MDQITAADIESLVAFQVPEGAGLNSRKGFPSLVTESTSRMILAEGRSEKKIRRKS